MSADTADWRRALERFESLWALPEAQRAAALERLRVEDPEVHAQVAKLLDADRAASDSAFLADAGAVVALAQRSLDPRRDNPDLAGTSFGHYRLIRELGAGGMGRVWLARRDDGLYVGDVAIKLLKAALATRGARERFAREGRILGALAHPNIARLLDAGTLDDGQLYLVLEFVAGERIDEWCESRGLDTRARVRLFKGVCDAVAFAHANLVVHRDLKPSNILVTAGGVVKLLDFGIAKLLVAEQGESAETELTQLAGRALTPEYAAPEQVSGAPVTTATDVYSLGVVLYHLLAGEGPYRREDGSRPNAFELQREVLETEPRRLSAVRPARKDLAGDLENIVAKALKKAPSERYASAQQLGEDLARYLDNRPVAARADSAGYVLGKFVRRHRVVVAGAAAVLIAIGAGIAGVAWQAQVAREEGRRAQAAADKAQAVSKFMVGMFATNSTENPDPAKARQTTARELLDIGRARAGKDLAGNPAAHEEVLLLIGRLYFELGLLEESATVERERISLLRRDGGRNPRLAGALTSFAGTLLWKGELEEAMRMTSEAIAIFDAIGDRASVERAYAAYLKGNLLRHSEPDKALLALREAHALYEAHPVSSDHALSLRSLAATLLERGEAREAEETIAKGIAVGEQVWGPDGHSGAFMHQIAGEAHSALLRPAKAERSFLRALEIDERALGESSSLRPFLEAQLARVAQNGPRWREVRARLERVQVKVEADGPGDAPGLAMVRVSLAQGAMREGRLAQAHLPFERALPVYRKGLPKAMLAGALASAVQLEQQSGRDAAALLAELHGLARGPLAGNKPIAARIAELEARQLLGGGDADRARGLVRASLAAAPRPDPLSEAPLQLLLAEAEEASGNPREAERLAQSLLRAIERHEDRAYFADLEAHSALRLGFALARQGRQADARPYLERAVELRTARQDPASPRLAEARAALAALQR